MRKPTSIAVFAVASWLAVLCCAPGERDEADSQGPAREGESLSVLRRIDLLWNFNEFRGEPGGPATVILNSWQRAIFLNPEGLVTGRIVLRRGQILDSSENGKYVVLFTFGPFRPGISLSVQDRRSNVLWKMRWREELVWPDGHVADDCPAVVMTRCYYDGPCVGFSLYDAEGNEVNYVDLGVYDYWAMSANGAVVVAESYKGVTAFNARTDTLWTYEITSPAEFSVREIVVERSGGYVALDVDAMGKPVEWLFLLHGETGDLISKRQFSFAQLSMAFSPDGHYLVVADYDKVCLLRSATGEIVWTHFAGEPHIHFTSVSVSNSADVVVAGARHGVQGAYRSGELIGTRELEEPFARRGVKISSDGNVIAACTRRSIFYLECR